MRNKRHKVIKWLVGIGCCMVVMATIAIGLRTMILDYKDSHIVLDYEDTFMELSVISKVLIESRTKAINHEISEGQYYQLLDSYENLALYVVIESNVPTEQLKEFNDNVREIYGEDSPYVINVKYQRDYNGFVEGMLYWQLDLSINVLWKDGVIPDKKYQEYKNQSYEFFENFSRDKVENMYIYMLEILKYSTSDSEEISEPTVL